VQTDEARCSTSGARAANGKLRFHGEERALEADARLPLSGRRSRARREQARGRRRRARRRGRDETIPLELAYRVRADLGPLQSREPAIDVIVEATPGSTVTLDGEALELDAQGRGTPLRDRRRAGGEGVVEARRAYRVQPPEGETEQGELTTRIRSRRCASIAPQRRRDGRVVGPGRGRGRAWRHGHGRREVECARIDSHDARADRPGEHTIEVIARAPGKAPRVARIELRRVASLARRRELHAEPGHHLRDDHAEPGDVPRRARRLRRPRLQRRRARRNEHAAGAGRGLPGAPVPALGLVSAATDTALESRVRVLGTVAGEQAFRSPSGQIRTVPRVDATSSYRRATTRP
jgi:hypothetical protein